MQFFDLAQLEELLKNDETSPPLDLLPNPNVADIFNAIEANNIVTNVELTESGIMNLGDSVYANIYNSIAERIAYRSTWNMNDREREALMRKKFYFKRLQTIEDMCTKIVNIPAVVSVKEETILL